MNNQKSVNSLIQGYSFKEVIIWRDHRLIIWWGVHFNASVWVTKSFPHFCSQTQIWLCLPNSTVRESNLGPLEWYHLYHLYWSWSDDQKKLTKISILRPIWSHILGIFSPSGKVLLFQVSSIEETLETYLPTLPAATVSASSSSITRGARVGIIGSPSVIRHDHLRVRTLLACDRDQNLQGDISPLSSTDFCKGKMLILGIIGRGRKARKTK